MKSRLNIGASPNDVASPTKTITKDGLRGTYYSSNQGLVFLGPYLIDEIVSCQYVSVQSKVPVYGYASQYYDAAVEGKVLVNGQFTINYIDSNYLTVAIVEYFMNKMSPAKLNNAKTLQEFYAKLHEDSQETLPKFLEQLSKSGDLETITPELQKKITQYVVTNPAAASSVISDLRDKYWGIKNREDLNAIFLRNILSHDLASYTKDDKKLNGLRSMRPDQMPPFDLTVVHGNANINPQIRVLREVEITNIQQGLEPSGEPQTETYSFFCKMIDF